MIEYICAEFVLRIADERFQSNQFKYTASLATFKLTKFYDVEWNVDFQIVLNENLDAILSQQWRESF